MYVGPGGQQMTVEQAQASLSPESQQVQVPSSVQGLYEASQTRNMGW
jgi:hypothetical protein